MWVDTCMFNGEPVIQFRLKYLAPHVDHFFICEQRYTHQGRKKDTLYIELYKDWFHPYLDKITFCIDETNYEGFKTWDIENAQRNFPIPFILNKYPTEEFICSVCDCDEIPDTTTVKLNENLYRNTTPGAVRMIQPLFYYNLNWYICDWKRAFFLNDKSIKKFMNFQLFRNEKGPFMGEFQCGWHLSYFLSIADIQRKISSFAHSEFNKEEYKNPERLAHCIRTGAWPYNSSQFTLYTRHDLVFPPELLAFNLTIHQLQDSESRLKP